MFKLPKNKTPLTRIYLAMILVVAVFLQMGFVSVTTMECFSSGTEKIFLGEKKSCCTGEAAGSTETIAPQCCDIFINSASFYTYRPSQELAMTLDVFVTLPFTCQKSAPVVAAFFQQFAQSHLKVPPISGRDILNNICKYTL